MFCQVEAKEVQLEYSENAVEEYYAKIKQLEGKLRESYDKVHTKTCM
jgi:hypothetical protein